jgi:methionyl-tRNA synthetase
MSERHLVTSALPYINGVKHLGNLIGSMLPADVYARYLRLVGEEVLFICATDEHGTPAELAAAEAGLPVEQYCSEQHEVQRDLCTRFHLSFDHFGRSSSRQNAQLTQYFGRRLFELGFATIQSAKQLYSLDDERFLPDRYVIGTCPYCGFERARGDQCENCTRLLEPNLLIDPRSVISGSRRLEIRETSHLYLELGAIEPRIAAWIEGASTQWPAGVRGIARKWLDQGLEPRAITRDLSWGVPVDIPELTGKVYYVWFDAPIEYIGATVEWADTTSDRDAWRRWWTPDDASEVAYSQFMAKDNVPFHTITFPGMLLALGEHWKLPDYIKGVDWLTYDGGKFSTSQRRGVFMDEALDILEADYWRWVLCATAPERSDSNFTFTALAEIVNRDLVGLYGNLVNRVLGLSNRSFGPEAPEAGSLAAEDDEFVSEFSGLLSAVMAAHGNYELRRSVASIRAAWSAVNAFLERREPWRLLRTDEAAARATLAVAMNAVAATSLVASPIIPAKAQVVLDALGVARGPVRDLPGSFSALDLTPSGRTFEVPRLMFRKIEADDVVEWTERFGGDARFGTEGETP